jgi:hypothetical protein
MKRTQLFDAWRSRFEHNRRTAPGGQSQKTFLPGPTGCGANAAAPQKIVRAPRRPSKTTSSRSGERSPLGSGSTRGQPRGVGRALQSAICDKRRNHAYMHSTPSTMWSRKRGNSQEGSLGPGGDFLVEYDAAGLVEDAQVQRPCAQVDAAAEVPLRFAKAFCPFRRPTAEIGRSRPNRPGADLICGRLRVRCTGKEVQRGQYANGRSNV